MYWWVLGKKHYELSFGIIYMVHSCFQLLSFQHGIRHHSSGFIYILYICIYMYYIYLHFFSPFFIFFYIFFFFIKIYIFQISTPLDVAHTSTWSGNWWRESAHRSFVMLNILNSSVIFNQSKKKKIILFLLKRKKII